MLSDMDEKATEGQESTWQKLLYFLDGIKAEAADKLRGKTEELVERAGRTQAYLRYQSAKGAAREYGEQIASDFKEKGIYEPLKTIYDLGASVAPYTGGLAFGAIGADRILDNGSEETSYRRFRRKLIGTALILAGLGCVAYGLNRDLHSSGNGEQSQE